MKTETILGMTYHICKSQDDINECPDSANLNLVGEWGNVELNRNFGNISVSGTVKGRIYVSGTAQVGNIYVSGTAQVGNISVSGTAQVGYISVYGTVKGDISVSGTAQVGYISVSGTAQVGNIYVSGTAQVGYISVSGTAQVGYISVYGTVKGNISVSGTAQVGRISVSGTVKGNISVYGTAQVGYISVYGTVKGYNIGGETNIQLVDGYLFKTGRTSKRKGFTIRKGSTLKSVVDGKWIGEDGYVAEKDGFTAHGNTATQAISDCHFKILQRDFTGEPITLDTMMDIKTWRLYSGACESMSLEFCKQHAIDPNKQHRLGDVMPILEANNAYGLDRLKDFLA